jgi:hypothetical protein
MANRYECAFKCEACGKNKKIIYDYDPSHRMLYLCVFYRRGQEAEAEKLLPPDAYIFEINKFEGRDDEGAVYSLRATTGMVLEDVGLGIDTQVAESYVQRKLNRLIQADWVVDSESPDLQTKD